MYKHSFICCLLLVACSNFNPKDVISTGTQSQLVVLQTQNKPFNIPLTTDSILVVSEKIPVVSYEKSLQLKTVEPKTNDDLTNFTIVLNTSNVPNFVAKQIAKSTPVLKTPLYSLYTNVWATPQYVFVTNNVQNFVLNWQSYLIQPNLKESQLFSNLFALGKNSEEYKLAIMQKLGVQFTLPNACTYYNADSQTAWLVQQNQNFYQHFLFHKENITSLPINAQQAANSRDLYINKYIKNPEQTQIFTTRSTYFKKEFLPIQIKGLPCFVLRAWYAEDRTARRGYYERYYMPQSNSTYVIMDAFVHAPDLARNDFAQLFKHIAFSYVY